MRRCPLQTVASSHPIGLIVEDHAVLRASLHDWLEAIVPGASVLCAGSVEEALETLAHAVADVVLMDIGLPSMNGIEGTRLVHERTPTLPVVVLSILDDDGHVAEAMGAPEDISLGKPRSRRASHRARNPEMAHILVVDDKAAHNGAHGVPVHEPEGK